MSPNRVATYRLQLHQGFGFADATALADYLEELGVSHLYLSPILQARAGSRHGYDVVDHETVSTDLGGIEGLRALADAWSGEILIDIVPNHMAVDDGRNKWWWDVLKNGPGSRYADFFDIDWDPSEERLKRSILIPILGDHYGRVLEAGELKLDIEGDEPVVRYYEHTLPLAPSSREHDIERINADVDLLHEVLEAQHYRLAYWKAAGSDLNYRRFFAINDLAALRVDRAEVFDRVHDTVRRLLDEGLVHGLRVDHIDGLRYPQTYLERLRDLSQGAYVVVEKILEGDEELRLNWPVAGTTGYEAIPRTDGVLVDTGAEKPLDEFYRRFTGTNSDIEAMAVDSKMQIMDTELDADIERLTASFLRVCEDQRRYRDFTRPELRQTLRETIAAFPVYRTYAEDDNVSEEDVKIISAAIGRAADRRPDLDFDLFALLRDVLLGNAEGEDERALAMRFQQTTGPVMAKGLEDTLFYRYNRFVSLNEVGGDPGHFGCSVDDFHRFNLRMQETWPQTMRAGSTHDTKRSEDVRARLALLSEIPDAWIDAVERWSAHNDQHRDGAWPDKSLEYLLYQTLVGAWPIDVDRMSEYLLKAAKEAKVDTSWISPSSAYDGAVAGFVSTVMADPTFTSDLERFVAPLIEPGYINSLASCLLRLTSPGVPDIYQGTELWDLSLVDPDNRRPVDYEARRSIANEAATSDASAIWARRDTGAPKLFLIQRALRLRDSHPDAFGPDGYYEPMAAHGERSDHVVAFNRGGAAITIVPRSVLSLAGRWADTAVNLPEGEWVNAFTGDTVTDVADLSETLSQFPVALFERTG